MDKLVEKLESFLFDLLALVLPGFIFLSIALLPIYLDKLHTNLTSKINPQLANFIWNFRGIVKGNKLSSLTWLLLFVGLGYILGHCVKVISKFMYDLFYSIFDKIFIKIFNIPYLHLRTLVAKYQNTFLIALMKPFLTTLEKTIRNAFSFAVIDATTKYPELAKLAYNKYTELYDSNPPQNDKYWVFKIASSVLKQEKKDTMIEKLYAKYNFFKSLSFVFLFSILYFHLTIARQINDISLETFGIVALTILWYTFHDKYKRYYLFCGNETLSQFYYFLCSKQLEAKILHSNE